MPAAAKIKSGKYGRSIGLLLERGGGFQTRHERTLIVNSDQKKTLKKADLVEASEFEEGSGMADRASDTQNYFCVPETEQQDFFPFPTRNARRRLENGTPFVLMEREPVLIPLTLPEAGSCPY